jgi:hypothetical protein
MVKPIPLRLRPSPRRVLCSTFSLSEQLNQPHSTIRLRRDYIPTTIDYRLTTIFLSPGAMHTLAWACIDDIPIHDIYPPIVDLSADLSSEALAQEEVLTKPDLVPTFSGCRLALVRHSSGGVVGTPALTLPKGQRCLLSFQRRRESRYLACQFIGGFFRNRAPLFVRRLVRRSPAAFSEFTGTIQISGVLYRVRLSVLLGGAF